MHLFSDTDTVVTDVSWLRETARKDKSKVLKYSRHPTVKPKAVSPHTSCTSFHSNHTSFHLFEYVPCSIIIVVSADASSHLDTPFNKAVKPSAKPRKVNLFLWWYLNEKFNWVSVFGVYWPPCMQYHNWPQRVVVVQFIESLCKSTPEARQATCNQQEAQKSCSDHDQELQGAGHWRQPLRTRNGASL